MLGGGGRENRLGGDVGTSEGGEGKRKGEGVGDRKIRIKSKKNELYKKKNRTLLE